MILHNLQNGLAPLGMICQAKRHGSFNDRHFLVVTNYNSLFRDEYVVPVKTEADAKSILSQYRGSYLVVELHQNTICVKPVLPLDLSK